MEEVASTHSVIQCYTALRLLSGYYAKIYVEGVSMSIRSTILNCSLVLLLIMSDARAQERFELLSLDDSAYPVITASVLLSDADGRLPATLTAADFGISENGAALATPELECPQGADDAQINLVIVNDRSVSMQQPYDESNQPRIELLKAGVLGFVDAFDFKGNPRPRLAVTAFDMEAHMVENFTSDPERLNAAINGLQSSGAVGANYSDAFLGSPTGALTLLNEQTQTSNHRNVIVFITDGPCFALGAEPCFLPDEVIAKAKENDTQIFVVGIVTTITEDLRNVASQSRGEVFDNISSKADLDRVLLRIAHQAQGLQPCRLTWRSSALCGLDEISRNVELAYTPFNKTVSGQYTAPEAALAELRPESNRLAFPDIEPGETVTRLIPLEVVNASYRIDRLRLVPSDSPYFRVVSFVRNGNDIPVDDFLGLPMAPGADIALKVEFRQEGESAFRRAELFMDTRPCDSPTPIVLTGGLPESFYAADPLWFGKPDLNQTVEEAGELLVGDGPIKIDSYRIEPAERSEFQLQSFSLNDAAPQEPEALVGLQLNKDDRLKFNFSFTESSSADAFREARFLLETENGSFPALTLQGGRPAFRYQADPIIFDALKAGEEAQQNWTFVSENIPIRIQQAVVDLNESGWFSIDEAVTLNETALPLTSIIDQTIAANDELVFTIHYRPLESSTEDVEARLSLDLTPCGIDPVQIIASGLQPSDVPISSRRQFGAELRPHPVVNSAVLTFSLEQAANVKISIFDATGRQRMILPIEWREAGLQQVAINVGSLPAGVYLYHIGSRHALQTGYFLKAAEE